MVSHYCKLPQYSNPAKPKFVSCIQVCIACLQGLHVHGVTLLQTTSIFSVCGGKHFLFKQELDNVQMI